jgi:ABC-type Mn2+/Zn2+ transport system permease subunit
MISTVLCVSWLLAFIAVMSSLWVGYQTVCPAGMTVANFLTTGELYRAHQQNAQQLWLESMH